MHSLCPRLAASGVHARRYVLLFCCVMLGAQACRAGDRDVVFPPEDGGGGGAAGSGPMRPDAGAGDRDSGTDGGGDAGADAAINRAPVADTFTLELDEDTSISEQLTGSDADGDALSFELVDLPQHGALEYDEDSSEATYTPGPDFFGDDSFSFRVSDGSATSTTVTIAIEVLPVNDAPVATDTSVDTDEDTEVELTLEAADVEDDALSYEIVDQPEHGTLVVSAAPDAVYVPDADFIGVDSFTFRVNDGTVDSELATVAVHVAAINDAPAAVDDSLTVGEGGTTAQLTGGSASLLANDSDLELDAIAVTTTPVTAPAHGTLALAADGTFGYVHDGGESTADSFVYEICDDGTPSMCDTATVSMTITAVNDAPDAVADALAVNEGGAAMLLTGGAESVLDNDLDADGDALTVTVETDVQNGTLTLNADGTFSYAHDGSETASDSFVYEVCDDDATPLCDTATVAITVGAVNEAPVAAGEAIAVNEGGTTSVLTSTDDSVLDNDADADGDGLTVAVETDVQHGALTLNTNGTFSYTHDGTETASDSFVYEVCDDDPTPLCDTVTVAITVTGVNDAPVANADAYAVDEAGTLVSAPLSVRSNDTDAESDTLTVSTTPETDAQNGTLTLNADGTFTYVHGGGETTGDSFEYEVCDPSSLCDTAIVTITINPVNDAPVAADDDVAVDEGGTVTLLAGGADSVLDNDSDAEGGALVVTVDTDVQNGTLTLDPDGTFSYVHAGDETTSDSFVYEVCDDGTPSECDTATVDIAIGPVNEAPVAGVESITVDEGGMVAALVGGGDSVLDNDTDPDGDTLSASVVSGGDVQNGTLTLGTDGTFGYLHDGGETTSDSFTYRVCDDDATPLCDDQVVSITITPVNDAPGTVDDAVSVTEGGTATTVNGADDSVLDNDDDAENDALTVTVVAGEDVEHGTLTLNVDGTFSYVHDGGNDTADSFTYRVCDDGTPSQCDDAVVAIAITGVNDAPVAADDAIAVAEGGTATLLVGGDDSVLDDDTDADGDVLTVTVDTNVQNGTLTLDPDGTFSYVHGGTETTSDSFVYQVCDDDPTPLCDTATVSITITLANDAPAANTDTFAVGEDALFDSGTASVLANDTDEEGDTLTVSAAPVAGPTHGVLTLAADGTFDYDHDGSEAPSDAFTYQVCDDGTPSECDTAVVTLNVTAVNDAPVALGESITIGEGGTATALVGGATSLLDNDTDAEPGTLTVTVDDDVDFGTLILAPAGTFSYVHDGSENLSDEFVYQVCDGGTPSECDTATVTITISSVNDAPVAADDTIDVAEGGTVALLADANDSVLDNDSDEDSATLTVVLGTDVQNGTLTLNGDGTFSYTHDDSQTTIDTVTYQVCDDAATPSCDTATVSIDVAPVNDPPVAGAYSYTNVVGNTLYTVAAAGETDSALLLGDNDTDPEGATLSITAFEAVSAAGGSVTMNTNTGEFTYLPPAGLVNGSDSFHYTLSDGGMPAQNVQVTVDLTITNQLVWYVDAASGVVPATGRSSAPFTSLAQADAASIAGATNTIYVRPGTYPDGVSLALNQRLHGAGDAFAPSTTVHYGAGARPTIGAVTLASGNIVRGVDVIAPAGNAVSGVNVGTATISNARLTANNGTGISVTTGASLILSDLGQITARSGLVLTNVDTVTLPGTGAIASIAATNGPALDITHTGSGTVALVFASLSSLTSSSFGVRLSNTSGSLWTASTTVTDPAAGGISVSGATAGSPSFEFGSANVTLTGTSAGVSGDAYAFSGNAATTAITFAMSVNPATQNGRALFASSSGTINITSIPIVIAATGGAVLDLRGTTGNVAGTGNWDFSAVSSMNSTAEGIRLENLTDRVLVDSAIATTITGSDSHGVYGSNIVGLTLENATVTAAGDATNEHALTLTNATGSIQLANDVFTGMAHHGVQIVNTVTGSTDVELVNVDITNNDVGLYCAGSWCDGSGLVVHTAGAMTLTVDGLLVDRITGDGLEIVATAATSNVDAFINNGDFTNGQNGDSAIEILGEAGTLSYDVTNNVMTGWPGNVFSTAVDGAGTTVAGTITGNQVTGDGAIGGQGIRILGDADTTSDTYTGRFLVQNNTVASTSGAGFFVENRGSNNASAALHVTMLGNSSTSAGAEAFRVRSRDGTSLCAQVTGNTATTPVSSGFVAIESNTSSLRLYAPAATPGTGVAAANTYLSAFNPGSTVASTATTPALLVVSNAQPPCLQP